jgi:hypothetical protein
LNKRITSNDELSASFCLVMYLETKNTEKLGNFDDLIMSMFFNQLEPNLNPNESLRFGYLVLVLDDFE